MKKTKSILLMIFFIQTVLSQKKVNLKIEFPTGFDYGQIFVMFDNGLRPQRIDIDTLANSINLSQKYFSEYAAIQFFYKIPDRNNAYYDKSFFVSDTASSIFFKSRLNENDGPLDNYQTHHCIPFSEAGEAQLRVFTSDIQKSMDEFYKNVKIKDKNDSLSSIEDSLNNIYSNQQLQFIRLHSNLYYSFWLFRTYCANDSYLKADSLLTFFRSYFPKELQKSFEGVSVLNIINGRLLSKGKPAPEFEALDISKKIISLKNYRNKKVLIQFWASWCIPCIEELKFIRKIRSTYDSSKLVIISVSLDKNYAEFFKAAQKNRMSWIHIFNDVTLANKYNVNALPGIYLIDETGKIVYINKQEVDPKLVKLTKLIRAQ